MKSLSDILAALIPSDGGWRTAVPDNWLQGRTAYGGFSAALALHAAKATVTDLPPLRSALVAFVGPLSGEVTVTARLLRRGRNAAFVQAEVLGEAGLGLLATYVFMRSIESSVEHRVATAPALAPPGPDDVTSRGLPQVAFTQNFEMLDCRDDAVGPTEWLRWARLAERKGLDPEVELVAIADCLPPAALKIVGGHAPVSSMTWQLNVLDLPRTDDGWFLLRADTDHAHGGTSSQSMAIWSADGSPVAQQMQSVAVFA